MKMKKAPIVGLDLGLPVPVGTPAKAVVWGFGHRLTLRGLVTHHREDAYRVIVDTAVGDDGKDYWGMLPSPSIWIPLRGVSGDDGK